MEKKGLQVFAEGIYGVGFSCRIGQSIPNGMLSDHTAWAREQHGET